MRHCRKKHRLNRPQDQRRALLRSLATSLIQHEEIKTTEAKAKALKPYIEKLITKSKEDTVHSRRQVLRYIHDLYTGNDIEIDGKPVKETVLRKLFSKISPRYTDRNGGYTKIFKTEPRRGDASPMAIIQLI